jgi:hypothetical protein
VAGLDGAVGPRGGRCAHPRISGISGVQSGPEKARRVSGVGPSATVNLSGAETGVHTLYVAFTTNGSGDLVDLNWFQFNH